LGNLSTPQSVQKLQTALHAKSEGRSRFIASTPCTTRSAARISWRMPYAQCRSNRGAPGGGRSGLCGHRGRTGVQRWLGELALALRRETYRPDPIRRVFIPKPNGKLRPLGISTLARSSLHDSSDGWCSNRSLKPTFHQSSTLYRPGRNAQQAGDRGGKSYCSVVIRKSLTADLADYFGSIPHAELMRSGSAAGSLIGACCT